MKLIIISSPENILNEHEIVNSLFEEGLEYFHLRKPDFSLMEMEAYLKRIDVKYRGKVILHSCHDLAVSYDLKGVHYNARSPFKIENPDPVSLHKSCSLHTLKELDERNKIFDYVFLSPVFNSISKEGYKSNFNLDEIQQALSFKEDKPEVIALGGIDESKMEKAHTLGFDGVAVLGAFWNACKDSGDWDVHSAMKKFRVLFKECSSLK